MNPVDASDFSEAESGVVTSCLETIERKSNKGLKSVLVSTLENHRFKASPLYLKRYQ